MTQPQTLSNTPQKGTSDWFPDEFAVRKYIFDTWRRVCQSFGYQEYLTPLVEAAEIYRSKSGEDIGGSELTTFFDRGGRELAIRPEMTPSVTRMVTRIYEASPKPIRLFSIANFYRNEKPQRGRNREFWQLNCDIFGFDSILADLEILQVALEIMLSFKPPSDSFTLFINNRKLIDAVLPPTDPSTRRSLVRLLDKVEKITPDEFNSQLNTFNLPADQTSTLSKFVSSNSAEELVTNIPSLKVNPGYLESVELITILKKLGYSKWIKFKPNVIRGFDYYDGVIFEVFDNNPQNSRSMFGGGRYNGLSSIFGPTTFPATGFAPGDETTKLFLEGWKLLPQLDLLSTKIMISVFSPDLIDKSIELGAMLRQSGVPTEVYPDSQTKLEKQLKYASQKGIPFVAILGPQEVSENKVNLKNFSTGLQTLVTPDEIQSLVS